MCLYERELLNQKYQKTKKNNGIPPVLKDYRQQYIVVGCGWCKECRKAIANAWRIRLYEEIKFNKNAIMVNLSFSPESINELENEIYKCKYRGIEVDENGEIQLDVNLLAAFAIRRFCERWRKKHKKAPHHWLITELGHKNSERIHLHGIMWDVNKKELEETWKYGNIVLGTFVNEKTINYIVKYVTKLDEYHKGYKQRIFASKGIGKSYVQNNTYNKFDGENTKTYYVTHNGHKLALPRYYKEKLWSEEEREQIWSYQLDKNVIYLDGEKFDKGDEKIAKKFKEKLENARKYNELCGYGNNNTQVYKYTITEIMKKKGKINYNKEKIAQRTEKRNTGFIYIQEDKSISKKIDGKTTIYKDYTGNTLESERNYNELLEEAQKLNTNVRKLRLYKAGILQKNELHGVKL